MNDDPKLGTPEHAARITAGRHQSTVDALLWLCFSHLPEELQRYSRPAYQTAVEWILANDDSPELTKALNALTEAKDWVVRAGIRTSTGKAGPVPRPATVVDRPSFTAGGAYPAPPPPSAGYPAGHPKGRPVRDNPQA
jgi:hypothetical protein